MSVSAQANSSKIAFDGALIVVQRIERVQFASGAAQDNLSNFVAPCNLTLVRAIGRILASGATSTYKLSIGTTASGDKLNALPLNNIPTNTVIDFTADPLWVSKTLNKGDYCKVKLPAGGAGAGVLVFAGSLVWAPTTGQA